MLCVVSGEGFRETLPEELVIGQLPVDYKLFGRTFDGIDYRFLKPIKENFPRDYEKIITWFPLAELELFRRGEL